MTKASATPRILFTTTLNGKHLKALEEVPVKFRQVPFITFEYPDPDNWLEQAQTHTDAWIFTSKRAVKALMPVLGQMQPPEKIYAVGPKTAKKIRKQLEFEAIIPEDYNVEALSKLIEGDKTLSEVTHFCGNLKSALLKNTLQNADIKVREIEVYQTAHAPKQVETRIFDGFVFMSPSAVESFMENNELDNESAIFCIGPSTARAFDAHDIHRYHLPEESTFNSLIETIENYFA